jgi:hypothetical protein
MGMGSQILRKKTEILAVEVDWGQATVGGWENSAVGIQEKNK